MASLPALPAYTDEELAQLELPQLIDLMISIEDRVPRNVIDECARRGEPTAKHLHNLLLAEEYDWDKEMPLGEWWLRLHAVMILGLITGEHAGLALVQFMRRMSGEEDGALQDWFAGYWPALFANKPDSVLPALRDLCLDRDLESYIRANAIDLCFAAAASQGEAVLEQAQAWVAEMVADEDEDWDLRLMAGNKLLDFPRPQHRPLLEAMAKEQTGMFAHFGMEDVHRAYAKAQDKPEWSRFKDPWKFYSSASINARQQRWQEETKAEARRDAAREKERDEGDDYSSTRNLPTPYVRVTTKTGRNDPCPCGSGKKYKKCCLSVE